ncbi:hypothetical protein PR048_003727 [Dryococelus australis]|uniref:mRNA (guanine-N(7))-methyltransferase n=1 Tax=Dryococelus australis TaxID=614101 RepID=A0ABQ9IP02_9NEOP|nr:hypothetical protein PR048_003727 [Dryococelus australis]
MAGPLYIKYSMKIWICIFTCEVYRAVQLEPMFFKVSAVKNTDQDNIEFRRALKIICDRESILNSRSLTYISEDPQDLEAFKPAMFLQDIRKISVPDYDQIDSVDTKEWYRTAGVVRGSMNTEAYWNILDNEMLPKLWRFSEWTRVTSRMGMPGAMFQGILCSDTPTKCSPTGLACPSPDLNPIEHLWDELDRRGGLIRHGQNPLLNSLNGCKSSYPSPSDYFLYSSIFLYLLNCGDGKVELGQKSGMNVSQSTATASDLSTKALAVSATGSGHGSVVASHYNAMTDKGLKERYKSRIFYLRNFNNWMKSMLINDFMSKIWQLRGRDSQVRVLDMCCGKGGDLLKWRRGNIGHLVCADLAAFSVEQCQNRYNDLVTRSSSERGFAPIFSAEFITADCAKVRLKQRYQDSSMLLDLVSCQFAFHYCFESLPQAECMLQNAAECLRPGGFFIGTIPDAYEIVRRLKASGSNVFGNDLYTIEFECDTEHLPLFGAKYNFHLEGVVDCPEFLVHFPTLKKMAEKFGLRLVSKKKFSDFYKQQKEEGRSLLGKMQALETYPPFHEAPLLGKTPDDYEHVEQYMQQFMEKGHRRVGTLSKSEWEAGVLPQFLLLVIPNL